eukprot:GDKI01005648.1.p1 GENE.GDKI01005648.1~~GDKI01005648.1.p1  ORF type:complete len:125 (-),score=13.97 GDKI01005648.1:28-402(-)
MKLSTLRAGILALLGAVLQANGEDAANVGGVGVNGGVGGGVVPKFDIPEKYGVDNSLILDIQNAHKTVEVKELLKTAHNLHVKWIPPNSNGKDGGDQKAAALLYQEGVSFVLEGVNRVKEEGWC